jgi:hypothetical protein
VTEGPSGGGAGMPAFTARALAGVPAISAVSSAAGPVRARPLVEHAVFVAVGGYDGGISRTEANECRVGQGDDTLGEVRETFE